MRASGLPNDETSAQQEVEGGLVQLRGVHPDASGGVTSREANAPWQDTRSSKAAAVEQAGQASKEVSQGQTDGQAVRRGPQR